MALLELLELLQQTAIMLMPGQPALIATNNSSVGGTSVKLKHFDSAVTSLKIFKSQKQLFQGEVTLAGFTAQTALQTHICTAVNMLPVACCKAMYDSSLTSATSEGQGD